MPQRPPAVVGRQLYTPEERIRRDRSRWTVVQGVLAPLQLLAFLVSLWLVLSFLRTGDGATAATISVIVKTGFLYAIMITGAIWEKEVFGVWLFARPFFWEDVVSMAVIALHSAYLYAFLTDALDLRGQMLLALVAYATYAINASQFFYKLMLARRESDAGGHAKWAAST
ncbi:MAG: 2-vinyl bacteriochlorophyllide hydratase [Gammaproteobacteria bacterium]|jgi:3-vinyl bacteriochlorophyllide hydratase|nr:2-vinyl bacteriochlorophyllide hydratase [Gammaproteobacteria bacterium]